MDEQQLVQLTIAPSELEASLICGLLESNGIRAAYDKGGILGPQWWAARTAFVGPQQILVRAADATRARQLLAETQKLPSD